MSFKMDKENILAEIRRTAGANGGKALGLRNFETETGIGYTDWYPGYWLRWSDAVREAGLEPNQKFVAYDDEFLLENVVRLTRRLGHVPVQGEFKRESKEDCNFPSSKAISRLGTKSQLASRIVSYCEDNPGNDDVASLWREVPVSEEPPATESDDGAPLVGYVYLLKHGSRREYKIGKTNDPVRREGELGIQLPEKCQPVHYIKTDDPAGVEAYWHNRFRDKRKEGEWFALTPQDVKAFKRWKRIY